MNSPLTACRSLRALLSLVLFFVVCLTLPESTQALNPPSTMVYPTGSFPLDVQNVQSAIDGGGIVVLKATNASGQPTAFNFGPPVEQPRGGVDIHTDVRIEGEHVGQNNTTIRGGFFPIACSDPVKSTIQGITFDGPLDCPIGVFRSTGMTIIGNHIENIIPVNLSVGFSEIEGLFVVGYPDPQNITGRLKIADNIFEISGGDFVNGMQLDDVAADIEISGNNVQFIESHGVVLTTGILVVRGHGTTKVANNRMIMGPAAPGAYPTGIFIEGDSDARYLISLNTITTNPPIADGIDIVGDRGDITVQGAAVVANHITIHSTIPYTAGIAVAGGVTDSLISANQIDGSSGSGLQIFGIDNTLMADSNLAVANDISQLSTSNADIYLGPYSSHNRIIGHCATYIDLGTANYVSCGTPLGFAADSSVTAANRTRVIREHRDAIQKGRVHAMRIQH